MAVGFSEDWEAGLEWNAWAPPDKLIQWHLGRESLGASVMVPLMLIKLFLRRG